MSEHNYTQQYVVRIPMTPEQIDAMRQSIASEKAERAALIASWREHAANHPKRELLNELIDMAEVYGDEEGNHSRADDILLELIGDDVVSAIFNDFPKWYA